MKNHAHIKAEINDDHLIIDVSGNNEGVSKVLAEIMKQLDARGYAEVVRTALEQFFDYLP